VSGQAQDRITAEQVLSRVRSMVGGYYGAKGKLFDRIAVRDTSQVDVKLYVLEVDRTFMNQLGIRLQSGTPNPNNPNEIILGPPSFPVIENQRGIGSGFTLGPFFRTTTLVPTLDLLLQTSHARVLSSPDLVTLPGNEATFLVGGEIPIPYSTGLGTYSITYKDFGVKLDVIPTILSDGSVQTLIKPEVSNLDFQDAITLNGFVIPALQVSRLNTDVTTKPGESIIMGGLLKRVEQRQINKIPLLGDLPILGKLFRSTLYQRADTDVVFVMTPTIITR
jgi:pilus assembly protein CpaC